MKMSSKARYGLLAVVELAKNYQNGVCSLTDVAQKTGVAVKYLEQIISILKKDNVVTAYRGSCGGYVLSDSPENISVGRILRSLEDNLELVDCNVNTCSKSDSCATKKLWSNLQNSINTYLDTISLKQLLES